MMHGRQLIRLCFAIIVFFFCGTTHDFAQDPSAIIDFESDTQGILIPRMTEDQRSNIINPAEGLMVYQSDNDIGFYFFSLMEWKKINILPSLSEILDESTNAENSLISNLLDPSNLQDILTKSFTDELIADSVQWIQVESVIYHDYYNIGIKTQNPGSTLEIDGSLTLSTDSIIGPEGSLRYNANLFTFEFSDGNAWRSLYDNSLSFIKESASLTASDADNSDQFSGAIAVDGSFLIVGASLNDGSQIDEGSAYIFEHDGNNWVEVIKLSPSPGYYRGYFGNQVDIEGDVAVVCAPRDEDLGTDAGAVYVYRRIANVWTFDEKLTASDGTNKDYFGSSASVSGDYLVIGASGVDDFSLNGGAAYVFKYDGTDWIEETKFSSSDNHSNDGFGGVTDIDGDQLIIGVPSDGSGSVYVFSRSGSTWIEETKINPPGGSAFGSSIELDFDIIVASDPTDASQGSVFIYQGSGNAWTQITKITEIDPDNGNNFGIDIDLNGNDLIIGTSFHGDNNLIHSQRAYTYIREGNTWKYKNKLSRTANISNLSFGRRVASNSNFHFIGSQWENGNSGIVYIYDE